MSKARIYSYELEDRILQTLAEEFGAAKIADKFYRAIAGKGPAEIEKIGQEIFTSYGRDWMKRTMALARAHPDRTWEVLQAAAEHAGRYRFGIFPQHFLEIAYLSIQDFSSLPVKECNARRLRYQLNDCTIFKQLQARGGDQLTRLMPCRHACLTALQTVHDELGLDATVSMPHAMVPDGYCEFVASRAETG
ncbi:MAG: hypothetical protein V1780_02270 [Chloroflexota bacterium]